MRIEDLFAELTAATLGRVRVALPAQVLAYDSTKQVVSAQVAVSLRRQDPDTGVLVPYVVPPISNVPVLWPSSSLGSLTFPLAPGDPVVLLIADRSLDEWKSTGAAANVPMDVRRFDFTDALAIPGGRPFTRPLAATAVSATGPVLDGADVRLGDGTASDFVALSSLVLGELNKILTLLQTWTVSGGDGGAALQLAAKSLSIASVAATKVKAK